MRYVALLRRWVREIYCPTTYNRSSLYILAYEYFEEFKLLFKINLDVFREVIPLFGIFRFIKFYSVKEKLEFWDQHALYLCVSACLCMYVT
jgi:hypothetical protein